MQHVKIARPIDILGIAPFDRDSADNIASTRAQRYRPGFARDEDSWGTNG
jgi:hypothetical protein